MRRANMRSESHCTAKVRGFSENTRMVATGPTKDLHVHEVSKVGIGKDEKAFDDNDIRTIEILRLFRTLMLYKGVDRYLYALALA